MEQRPWPTSRWESPLCGSEAGNGSSGPRLLCAAHRATNIEAQSAPSAFAARRWQQHRAAKRAEDDTDPSHLPTKGTKMLAQVELAGRIEQPLADQRVTPRARP